MNDENIVLKAIIAYKQRHDGNSPTYRDLMAMTGLSSTSTVAYHLDNLERAGRIRRPARTGNSRVIEVVGGRWVAPLKIRIDHVLPEPPPSGTRQ